MFHKFLKKYCMILYFYKKKIKKFVTAIDLICETVPLDVCMYLVSVNEYMRFSSTSVHIHHVHVKLVFQTAFIFVGQP